MHKIVIPSELGFNYKNRIAENQRKITNSLSNSNNDEIYYFYWDVYKSHPNRTAYAFSNDQKFNVIMKADFKDESQIEDFWLHLETDRSQNSFITFLCNDKFSEFSIKLNKTFTSFKKPNCF